MNQLCIGLAILVAFIYCGGSSVPPVLKKYKLLILGLTIGCVACCALGKNMGIEGLNHDDHGSCGGG